MTALHRSPAPLLLVLLGVCSTAACAAVSDHPPSAANTPTTKNAPRDPMTPNVANNPPVPSGWQLMQQSAVTAAMTAWAVEILHDPTTHPMYSTTTQTFGALSVLARVEWHPPDFQNMAVHRGVTLYRPSETLSTR